MPLYPHLAGSCIADDSGNFTLELLFGLGGICPPGGPEYPPDTRVFKMTRQLGLRVSDKMAQSRYFLRMLQQLPWVPKADPVESERAVASAGADADAAKAAKVAEVFEEYRWIIRAIGKGSLKIEQDGAGAGEGGATSDVPWYERPVIFSDSTFQGGPFEGLPMAVVKGANAALVLQGGSAFAGTAVGDRLAFAEAMRAQCVRGEPGAIRRYNESRSEATIRLGVAAGMQVTMSIFFIVEHAGSPDSSSLLIDEFLLATADQSVGSSPARKAIEEAQSEELMGQLDESKTSLDKKIRDQENRESAGVCADSAPRSPHKFDYFVRLLSMWGGFPFAPASDADAASSKNLADKAECTICNQNVDPADAFVHTCGEPFHHDCIKSIFKFGCSIGLTENVPGIPEKCPHCQDYLVPRAVRAFFEASFAVVKEGTMDADELMKLPSREHPTSQAFILSLQCQGPEPEFAAAYAIAGIASSKLQDGSRGPCDRTEHDGLVNCGIFMFKAAIALDPNGKFTHEWYWHLGKALLTSGDNKGAVRALRHSIALAPEFAPAHASLQTALPPVRRKRFPSKRSASRPAPACAPAPGHDHSTPTPSTARGLLHQPDEQQCDE
jgi:hypothetical protein